MLQGLRPKESELKDFAGCQGWLKKVKSLSVTVDLILSDESLVKRHGENAENLAAEIGYDLYSQSIVEDKVKTLKGQLCLLLSAYLLRDTSRAFQRADVLYCSLWPTCY